MRRLANGISLALVLVKNWQLSPVPESKLKGNRGFT